MIAIVILADAIPAASMGDAISLVIGEAIRDVQYAQIEPQDFNLLQIPTGEKSSRWFLFSGPFLLTKQRYRLPSEALDLIVQFSHLIFSSLILAQNVRSLVRT